MAERGTPPPIRKAQLDVGDLIIQLQTATVKDGANIFQSNIEAVNDNAIELQAGREKLWEIARSFEYYKYLGCRTEEEMRHQLNGPPLPPETTEQTRTAKALREIRQNWGEDFHLTVKWPVPAGEKMSSKTKAISKCMSLEDFSSQIELIMDTRINAPPTRYGRKDNVVMLSDVQVLESKLIKKGTLLRQPRVNKASSGSSEGGKSEANSLAQALEKGKEKQRNLLIASSEHQNESDYGDAYSGGDEYGAFSPISENRANQGIKRKKTSTPQLPTSSRWDAQESESLVMEAGRRGPSLRNYEEDTDMFGSDFGPDVSILEDEKARRTSGAMGHDESTVLLGFNEEEFVQTPQVERRLSLVLDNNEPAGIVMGGFGPIQKRRQGDSPMLKNEKTGREFVGPTPATEISSSPIRNTDAKSAGVHDDTIRPRPLAPSADLPAFASKGSSSPSRKRESIVPQQITSAISNLTESGKLNDEAVNTCLEWELAITGNNKFAFLNTFFFNPYQSEGFGVPDTASRKLDSQKRVYPCLQNPLNYTFFAPIHHASDSHWSLVTINFKEPSISHYDSLESAQRFDIVATYIERWMRLVDPALEDRNVTRQQHPCPQQIDGISCGDFVIAFATAILHDTDLPPSDSSLQENYFRNLRDQYCQYFSSINNQGSLVSIASTGRGQPLFQRNRKPEGRTGSVYNSPALMPPKDSSQPQQNQFPTEYLVDNMPKVVQSGEDSAMLGTGYKQAELELKQLQKHINNARIFAGQATNSRTAAEADWFSIVNDSAGHPPGSGTSTTFIKERTNRINAAGEEYATAAMRAEIAENGVTGYNLREQKFQALVAAFRDFEESKAQTKEDVQKLDTIMRQSVDKFP